METCIETMAVYYPHYIQPMCVCVRTWECAHLCVCVCTCVVIPAMVVTLSGFSTNSPVNSCGTEDQEQTLNVKHTWKKSVYSLFKIIEGIKYVNNILNIPWKYLKHSQSKKMLGKVLHVARCQRNNHFWFPKEHFIFL